MKKQLSRHEEFEILKLVLDKVLWLGFGIAGIGMYVMYASSGVQGFFLIIAGVLFLLIFSIIVIKEFEIVK